MNNRYKSLGMAYLYKIYDGDLQEYYGEIAVDNRPFIPGHERKAVFRICNMNGTSRVKTFVCVEIEGAVYNGMVWFKDADMVNAARVLCNHELDMIRQLKKKILQHKKTIDILKLCEE